VKPTDENRDDPVITLLVVDPKVLVRMVLADYLRSCDYRVVEAADSDEAVLILEQEDISISAAIVEVDLRGALDGFTLARWIRTNKPSIKVQLVGTITKAANAAVELCEEQSILPAPYSHQTVVDRIRRLLAAAERNEESGDS
jgi:CheY-like chemotaxis protein